MSLQTFLGRLKVIYQLWASTYITCNGLNYDRHLSAEDDYLVTRTGLGPKVCLLSCLATV